MIYKFKHILNRKKIYVGCLYSKKREESYNNYQILLESFKFSITKYKTNIEIIPIYTDLGDNLDNYSKWVEECVTKYNIKYFFGCWFSSERKQIIPILKKYNARLFYPLHYEGFELCNNIYYLGASPNQYLIPGIKYIFDSYHFYNDVYVIGNDSIYCQIMLKIIDHFITDKTNTKKYNNKLKFAKLYQTNTSDYSDFILYMFKNNQKGAILINILEGKSYLDFVKQMYILYLKYFTPLGFEQLCNNLENIKYLDKNIDNENIRLYHRYPSISFSINNYKITNDINNYLLGSLSTSCYTNHILYDPVYLIYDGVDGVDRDLIFLKNYCKNTKKSMGDAAYCTFLSTQFFCKTLNDIIKNNEDINDTNIYDKYSKQVVDSVSGEHSMLDNKHITRHFLINFIENNEFLIQYQSFNEVDPDPFMGIYDKIFTYNNNNVYYSSRYFIE